jgi:hypothetical protein
MPSHLDNLVSIGQLKLEPPDQGEIDGLLRSGAARIEDAENEGLSLESRFDLAYNAAHAFALAALRHHGYRSEHRYLVFQALKHTAGLENAKWRVLDDAHRKRNRSEYEGSFVPDKALVEGVIRVAREVEAAVHSLGPVAGGSG